MRIVGGILDGHEVDFGAAMPPERMTLSVSTGAVYQYQLHEHFEGTERTLALHLTGMLHPHERIVEPERNLG